MPQDTKWESNKITINITNKSQEVSPFPSGDHKAAMNRRESMANMSTQSEIISSFISFCVIFMLSVQTEIIISFCADTLFHFV